MNQRQFVYLLLALLFTTFTTTTFQNCQKYSAEQSESSFSSTSAELPQNSEWMTESGLVMSLFKTQETEDRTTSNSTAVSCQILGNTQTPLVTQYPQIGSTEQPLFSNDRADEQIRQGQKNVLVYNLNVVRMPSVGQYIGHRFSTNAYNSANAQARLNQVLSELCAGDLNQVKFVQNSTEVFSVGDLKKLISENVPYFQVIHSIIYKNNLFTVIVPPRWSAANSQNLPTLFNGFYDLNENLMDLEGLPLFKTLANAYSRKGQTGFGILWNGNGAIGSRTVDRQAYAELNDFLKIFLADTGASSTKFVSFGVSRGGITALNIASQPEVTAVKVAFAYSSCPPNEISEYQKYSSTTVPFLLYANDWSTGIFGSWRKNFVFPAGYGRQQFEGLNGFLSHFKALTGTSDINTIAQQNNALTSAKIQKLKQNNTQIFLEMGSHDFIVPSVDQMKLFDTASAAGIKIEGRVNYLFGHQFDSSARQARLNSVLESLLSNSNTSFIQNQRLTYYITSPEGTFRNTTNNQKLTYIELPRLISEDMDTVVLGAGQAQQKLLVIFKKGTAYFSLKLTADSQGYFIQKIDPNLFPEGDSEFVGAYLLDSSEKATSKLNVQFTTKNSNTIITHFKGDTQPYTHTASGLINSLTYGPNRSLSYFNSDVSHGSNFGFIVTDQASLSASDQENLKRVLTAQQPTQLSIQCPTQLTAGDNASCTATDSPANSLTSGYWTVNGSKVNNSNAYAYTWFNVPAGTYTVQAFAKDLLNRDVKSNIIKVTIAAKPLPPLPLLKISCPTALTAGDNASCTATDSPANSLVSGYWTVNGAKVDNSSTYAYTWYNVPAGTYYVQAIAKDFQNREVKSNTITVIIKPKTTSTVPMLKISCPSQLTAGDNASCTATDSPANSLASGYWTVNGAKVDNSNAYSYTWYNVPAGNYQVQAIAKDFQNRDVRSNVITVNIASKPLPAIPTLKIYCPTTLTAGSNATCTATDSPANSLVSGYWTVNGEKVDNSNAYAYSWYNVPAGTYTVKAFGVDQQGRKIESNSITVVIRP